ncbi:uncharacterized protein TNCV_1908231 [Trichonephila clavipes]|nr:uncharacterized protein TNCV_1908231 [Trichonephila clavipes]
MRLSLVLLKTSRVSGRCKLSLSMLRRPPVGVVWKLRERDARLVSSSSLDHSYKLRGTGEYFPPLQFTCRNCGGGDRGRVAIYRPFGEVSLSLNRTVTCMVLKANDRRTFCPCHDEFRGPRSDYVRQVAVRNNISKRSNTTENDVSKTQSSADTAIRLPKTSILN